MSHCRYILIVIVIVLTDTQYYSSIPTRFSELHFKKIHFLVFFKNKINDYYLILASAASKDLKNHKTKKANGNATL